MNSTNQRGKTGTLLLGIIIGLVLAILVIAILCGVFFWKASKEPATVPPAENVPAQTQTPAPAPEQEQQTTEPAGETADAAQSDMTVETPYCTLAYPGKWNTQVRAEQIDSGDGYTVNFYGTSQDKEVMLFSVLFGKDAERSERIGAIVQNGIATEVGLDRKTLSGKAATEELLAMQADAEYLVERLKANLYFQLPEGADEELIPDLSDAAVETPYGTLYYSGEWKDAVSWEVSSEGAVCTVSFAETFSGTNAPAFILCFGDPENTGFQMGTLEHNGSEVPVCLTLCDFPEGNTWSDSDRSLFLMIQEQAYNMLEKFAEEAPYTSVF